MHLLAFWIPSFFFFNCLFIFSIRAEILFLLIYKNSLYLLDVPPLFIPDIVKSPTLPSVLTLFMVSFIWCSLLLFPYDQISLFFALEVVFEILF